MNKSVLLAITLTSLAACDDTQPVDVGSPTGANVTAFVVAGGDGITESAPAVVPIYVGLGETPSREQFIHALRWGELVGLDQPTVVHLPGTFPTLSEGDATTEDVHRQILETAKAAVVVTTRFHDAIPGVIQATCDVCENLTEASDMGRNISVRVHANSDDDAASVLSGHVARLLELQPTIASTNIESPGPRSPASLVQIIRDFAEKNGANDVPVFDFDAGVAGWLAQPEGQSGSFEACPASGC